MASIREVKEGEVVQGPLESRRWSIDTKPRGGNPANADCTLTLITYPYHESDVSDLLSGVTLVEDDNIITPVISGLVKDEFYRLETTYDQMVNGSVEARNSIFLRIRCK